MSTSNKVKSGRGCLRRLITALVLVFSSIAICVASFFAYGSNYCEQRKNPPTVPIYPSATLTDTAFSFVGRNYTLWPIIIDVPNPSSATYYYATLDLPEQVIEFYAQKGEFSGAHNQWIRGNAEPFGEYYVGIPARNAQTVNGITEYFIEVHWESCR
jgi:hypothetical protein